MKKSISKPKSVQKNVRIEPLGDRVLIRPFSPEETTSKTISGIIIPDTLDKEKPEQGEVIAVGPGKYDDGKLVPMRLSIGDKVVFSKYGYDEVKIAGEEYYILKEDNILAKIQ